MIIEQSINVMPKRWTKEEENFYRKELSGLYTKQNKTIAETGKILGLSEKTIFQRLGRLGIASIPDKKKKYRNQRSDVKIPKYTPELAEFFGIMLGDGHLTHFQVTVTLGSKEASYAQHIVILMKRLFGGNPKIAIRDKGYRIVYLGSTKISSWLFKQGLVKHKVKSQVDVPRWIFSRNAFMRAFLRGFFDTDGSVYKLRFGVQVSFTNRSFPLIKSLHKMLLLLHYRASAISNGRIYLTKRSEVERFFREIDPKNQAHPRRFADAMYAQVDP